MRYLATLLLLIATSFGFAVEPDPRPVAPAIDWTPTPDLVKQQSPMVYGAEFVYRADAVIVLASGAIVTANTYTVNRYGPWNAIRLQFAIPVWYLKNWTGSASAPVFTGSTHLVTAYQITRTEIRAR